MNVRFCLPAAIWLGQGLDDLGGLQKAVEVDQHEDGRAVGGWPGR